LARSLLIANDFPPVGSGIATFFGEIWKCLPADQTAVIAPSLPGSRDLDRDYPIPVQRHWLPLSESPQAKVAKTILTIGHMIKAALLARPMKFHCGQVLSSGIGGLVCKRTFGIPYTVWVYGSETVRLGRGSTASRLIRAVLTAAECVITNSEMTSEEFRAFGVPAPRVRRIYPGVDPARYRPAARRTDMAESLGLGSHRVLLTVARLDQRKGHDTVLRALAHLGRTDIVYLIAGRGREEERLKGLAAELGVQARVRFLGFVADEDLPSVYNLCDVFVMPNRVTEGTALQGDIEGFGITFVEAGACGKPVIAGRSGGAVEAVLDGVTGLLVDPQAPEDTARAIAALLDDPDLAARLGREARKRIQREFDWKVLARQVKALL
jgi:phosphatidyl-myo-inositol dimannoside synthase